MDLWYLTAVAWEINRKRSFSIKDTWKRAIHKKKNKTRTLPHTSYFKTFSLNMDISNNYKQGNMVLSMKKIKNLQQNIFKKAEEPEIKLPAFSESWRKQGSSRKTSTSALLTMPKSLTAWITRNCEKFLKSWEYQTTLPVSWETYMQGQEATVRTGHGTTDWFQIGKGAHQGCILSPC